MFELRGPEKDRIVTDYRTFFIVKNSISAVSNNLLTVTRAGRGLIKNAKPHDWFLVKSVFNINVGKA